MNKTLTILLSSLILILVLQISAKAQTKFLLLSTKKTSTMQKEMQEAAENGFRFQDVTGGKTSFGGSEALVIMSKSAESDQSERFQYKLLATKKTSTMQKEMQEAGNNGFVYKGHVVFGTFFGGDEVVAIMEKDLKAGLTKFEYKLLATKRTSTMQKELNEASEAGFAFAGVTVGKTFVGGSEVVVIMQKIVNE